MSGDEAPPLALLAPLIERISRAESEVTLATNELDLAMRAIEVLPREEKRRVSQVVEDAFTKLRAVRVELAKLQTELPTRLPSLAAKDK